MQRVSVVGSSGSGKTWVADQLGARLGVRHVELDAVFWQPGWTELPTEQLRQQVAAVLATDSWVIDGNYTSRLGTMVLDAADTVVWLDPPRRQLMAAVVLRTLDRGLRRRELWNGNRESIRNVARWKPEENIIRWAWVNHSGVRSRYEKLMENPAYAHIAWIRLRSRRAINTWLNGL